MLLRARAQSTGVRSQRRYVLAAIALLLFVVAGLAIHRVLGTVFLAITVSYLLVPIQRRLKDRDVNEYWAAVAVTTGATVAALVPFAGVAYLVAIRFGPVLGFLGDLPDSVVVSYFGLSQTFVLADVVEVLVRTTRDVALTFAAAVPVLALKFTLFAILVFALLMNHEAAEAALVAPVPEQYHDVLNALGTRASETLYAIYVLQAATSLGTFVIAVPVFMLLGYPFPFTLAFVAGVLQFVPIVGPSLLIIVLGVWKVAIGDVTAALLLFVVAGLFVAWLPDVLIRPRLSRRTAHLPGSLYFIGFVGGLLTLGPIGVVAGPLAIALAVMAVDLLAKAERERRSMFDQ